MSEIADEVVEAPKSAKKKGQAKDRAAKANEARITRIKAKG